MEHQKERGKDLQPRQEGHTSPFMNHGFGAEQDMTSVVRTWVNARCNVKVFFAANGLTPETCCFLDFVLKKSVAPELLTGTAQTGSTMYAKDTANTVFRMTQSFSDKIDWTAEEKQQSYLLPQTLSEAQQITIRYGRIPRVIVRIVSEEEALRVLKGKKAPPHVKPLFGKELAFEGLGNNLNADRVYVREQLTSVTACWGAFISDIQIFFPLSFLDHNNATLIVSRTDTDTLKKSSIADASLLIITPDLANTENLLQYFLRKGEKSKQVVVLNTGTPNTEKDSRDTRGILMRCKVTDNVMPNTEVVDCTQDGATTLADIFYNLALFSCVEDLEDFSDSWMKRLTENAIGTRIPDLDSTSASSLSTSTTPQGSSYTIEDISLSSSSSSSSSSGFFTTPPQQRSAPLSFVVPENEEGHTEAFSPAHNLSFVLKMDQLSESFNNSLHISETRGTAAKHKMCTEQNTEEEAFVTVTADQILERFRRKANEIKAALCATPLELHDESAKTLGMTTFADAIQKSLRQAETLWSQFRDSFLATREACQYILNQKYEGECLGSDLKKLLCEPLISFSVHVWEETIIEALHSAENRYAVLTNDILDLCLKALDTPSLPGPDRMRLRQLLWQCQEGAEKIIFSHFQQAYTRLALKNMHENYESTIRNLCKQVIKTTLLAHATPGLTLRQFHRLVTDSFSVVPRKCASAVSLLFTSSVIGATAAKLSTIEAEVFRLIKSVLLVSSTPQHFDATQSPLQNTYGLPSAQQIKTFGILSGADTTLPEREPSDEMTEAYQLLLKQEGLTEAQTKEQDPRNSQFCSIARLSYGTEEAHTVVRLLAVGELLRCPHEFRALFPSLGALHAYARRMSVEGTPGDHISLVAFSAYACVDIAVYTPYSQQPLRIRGPRRNRPGAEHFADAMRQAASASAGGTLVLRIGLPRLGYYTPLLPTRTAELEEASQAVTYKRAYNRWAKNAMDGAQCKTLSDLCIAALARQAVVFPTETPQGLEEDLAARLLRRVIDDRECDGIDFDVILERLLQPAAAATLDLTDCMYFSEYTLATVARGCPELEVLLLAGCPRVQNSSLATIAMNCHRLTELSVRSCSLVDDEGLHALSEGCPLLTSLDVSFCQRITSLGLCAFQRHSLTRLTVAGCPQVDDSAFREFRSLEVLNAAQCPRITDETLKSLSANCAYTLRSLAVSTHWVTDAGIAAFIRSCPLLESLDFTGCNKVGQETLTAAFTSKCTLQSFTVPITAQGVEDDAFPFSVVAAVDTPFSSANLEHLNIAGADITDRTLVHVATFCPQLVSLVIAGCAHVTDAGLRILCSRLPLTTLDASRCQLVTDEAICTLAETSGALLRNILLGCSGVTDAGLATLACHCSEIRKLDVSHNERITDVGITHITGACAGLEVLVLEDCKGISDATLFSVSASSCRASIRAVKVGFAQGVTDAGVSSLGRCAALECCDFSYCPNVTLQGICTVVQGAPRLRVLELRGGLNRGGGGICQGAPLPTIHPHKSLRCVNLSWFRDDSVNSTLELLSKACMHLETVNLSRSQFLTDDAVRKLAGRCPSLRQVNLSGCRGVQEATIKFLVLSGISVLR